MLHDSYLLLWVQLVLIFLHFLHMFLDESKPFHLLHLQLPGCLCAPKFILTTCILVLVCQPVGKYCVWMFFWTSCVCSKFFENWNKWMKMNKDQTSKFILPFAPIFAGSEWVFRPWPHGERERAKGNVSSILHQAFLDHWWYWLEIRTIDWIQIFGEGVPDDNIWSTTFSCKQNERNFFSVQFSATKESASSVYWKIERPSVSSQQTMWIFFICNDGYSGRKLRPGVAQRSYFPQNWKQGKYRVHHLQNKPFFY